MKNCLRFIAFVCTAAAFAFILSFKAGCVDFGTDELYGALPENALEYTNRKFISRFNYIESKAKNCGKKLKDMTLAEMEELWQEAKKNS